MSTVSGCLPRSLPSTRARTPGPARARRARPRSGRTPGWSCSMAMSQRIPSHCAAMLARVSAAAARSAGANALSCTTSRQGGKYRVAAVGQHLAAGGQPARRVGGHVVRARRGRTGPAAGSPRGGPGRRGWARSRAPAPRRGRPARPAPRPARRGRRTPGRPRNGAPSTASRGRPRAAGWAARRGTSPAAAGSAVASARPAGLRSHTPISQTASTPAGVASSHSASGMSARLIRRPAARDSASSHTAVLIS